jgi:glyoxylase-like metal-dependent hydrolase (beta-lactamase superfamily II)
MEVYTYTVGPLLENCSLICAEGGEAVLVDPGEEAERLKLAIGQMDVTVKAILVTHTHFDHIGAVTPLAEATGAPVVCPELEKHVLADIMSYVRWPDMGPFESYEADITVKGGETLDYAGLKIDVIHTPGHSPGHVTYHVTDNPPNVYMEEPQDSNLPTEGVGVRTKEALISGDVLFEGSIGRTDLPGGDMATLMSSIAGLVKDYPPDTPVFPGHGPQTKLGRELASNPFLRELSGRL